MEGIDKAIQQIQDVLNNDIWQDKSLKVKHYGRTYRQNKAYGQTTRNVAMTFDEESKDYEMVMFDDTKDILSFIDLEDVVNGVGNDSTPQRDGRIVIAINLKTVYPEEAGKAPEKAYRDVIRSINNTLYGVFDLDTIEVGSSAYGDLYSDNIKRFNTYPYHVFAVLGTIKYFYNNC